MSVIHQTIALADGRFVEVLLGGDPVGYPLVIHHSNARATASERSRARGGIPIWYDNFTITQRKEPDDLSYADKYGDLGVCQSHSYPWETS